MSLAGGAAERIGVTGRLTAAELIAEFGAIHAVRMCHLDLYYDRQGSRNANCHVTPRSSSAPVHHQVEASGHDIRVSGGAPVAVTLIMSVHVIDDYRQLVGVEGCELRLHSTTPETGETPSQCAIRKNPSPRQP